MKFGIYIHIPYCRQICPYCDFTKYEADKIMPPDQYVELIAREIQNRSGDVPYRQIDTIYFGGGTPSLFEPSLILAILQELAKAGFQTKADAEITIEIDPATADENRLNAYLDIGITRFSVGAQTFNERLLKIAGRKHTSQDTVALLSLLKRRKVNYSFDLLFALPTQTLEELRADVTTALAFDPSHLSAYCLTVPEGHKMSVGRAPDEEQVEMFDLIENTLADAGINRYEISNFARPGFESKHNVLYWTDQAYWGLGTSAHSYFPPQPGTENAWGIRFWNPPSLKAYAKQIQDSQGDTWHFVNHLNPEHVEKLEKHQALTDFLHTSLRLSRGLETNALRLKFGDKTAEQVLRICDSLVSDGYLLTTDLGFRLSSKGRLVANAVFERLTFLRDEI